MLKLMRSRLSVFVLLVMSTTAFAADTPALLIRVTEQKQVDVSETTYPPAREVMSQPGLLVWMNALGRDRWIAFPATSLPEPEAFSSFSANTYAAIRGPSRGTGGGSGAGGASLAMLTTQLDQLVGGTVLRAVDDGGLATPMNEARQLSGAIIIRRTAARGEPQYPEDELLLRTSRKVLMKFAFPKGQAALRWQDIKGLPAELKQGLPGGVYQIRARKSGSVATFRIEDPAIKKKVLARADRIGKLTKASDGLVATHVRVESLLNYADDKGEAQPFLVDAYDALDALKPDDLNPHLAKLKDRLWKQILGVRSKEPESKTFASSGIEAIDFARRRILSGNWDGATKLLASPEATSTDRGKALATLYSAVVLAESGQATGAAADQRFQAALAMLGNAQPADALLVHNNYGNFLLSRSQDLLYNHAFQVATASRAPLFTALSAWAAAKQQYQLALQAANSLNRPQETAAINANIARLHVLLGDMLRVLNSALPDDARFASGQAMNRADTARQLETLTQDQNTDDATRAAAFEMRAHLAYRAEEFGDALKFANSAAESYMAAGSLAGVESTYRIVGLALERIDHGEDALRTLQVAHELSEFLREQFPDDNIGLTRAGFFARRTYVNDHIVALLVSQNRPADALEFADNAKARSLQDILASRNDGKAEGAPTTQVGRAVSEIVAGWPSEVDALEYYLGAERAWVFHVSAGKVTAHALTDEGGDPLNSRELIADVQSFLAGTNSTAKKLMRGAAAGRGFDHTWQDNLLRLRSRLLPESVLKRLSRERTLVVVPHHILHYFPFAALVVEKDAEKRGSYEMPQPKFLVDVSGAICTAPSLTNWDLLRRSGREPLSAVRAVGVSEFSTAPPLPGVKEDLAHVRQAFGVRVKQVLEGREATEDNARKLLNESGLAFFATHGINLADDPLSSYILLNGSDTNDGRLSSWEVFNQKIGADLIVMSACYSGLADRSPLAGDDLFGLERAFLHSGCRNVVSSMWDVYDDTGVQLIDETLKRLSAGDTASTAVTEAQRKFLAARRAEGPSDPWIHPYFWAVFKSTGDDTVRFATSD